MTSRRKAVLKREHIASLTLDKAIREGALHKSDCTTTFQSDKFALNMQGLKRSEASRVRLVKKVVAKGENLHNQEAKMSILKGEAFFHKPSQKPRHNKGTSFKPLIRAGLYTPEGKPLWK